MKRNAYNSLEYIKVEDGNDFAYLETKPCSDPVNNSDPTLYNLNSRVDNDWEAHNDSFHNLTKYEPDTDVLCDLYYEMPAPKQMRLDDVFEEDWTEFVSHVREEDVNSELTVGDFLRQQNTPIIETAAQPEPKPVTVPVPKQKSRQIMPRASRQVHCSNRQAKLKPLSDDFRRNLRAPLLMAGGEMSIKDDEFLEVVEESPEPIPVESIGDQVRNMLEELDREFETNYTSQSRHDWLTGPAVVRKECISRFDRNMHPSPKDLQEMCERFDVTYRMMFYNYDRLRINHNIKCAPRDNCNRIKDYFKAGSTDNPHARLLPDVRNLLEKEMIKCFEKDLKLTVGQIHVLCDITGVQPATVRSQSVIIRKRYLSATNPQDRERKMNAMMEEFEKNPFPNPKRYTEIATQFDMRLDEVQSFYNTERLKHVKMHGPYEAMEEVIDENVSNALWDLAKQGRQVNQERRQRIAKRFGISYITITFWLDNYISQVKSGTTQPTMNMSSLSTSTTE